MAVGDGRRNPRQHRDDGQQSPAVSYVQRRRLGLGALGWMVLEVFVSWVFLSLSVGGPRSVFQESVRAGTEPDLYSDSPGRVKN
jgi:hypothetical protein